MAGRSLTSRTFSSRQRPICLLYERACPHRRADHLHPASFRGLTAGRELTKSELITEIATAHPHLRGEDVETIVTTILGGIASALVRGDRVELRGFGAFTVRRRDPRTGRNPRNGDPVLVDAKSVPSFKAGKDLSLRVDAGRAARTGPKTGLTELDGAWLKGGLHAETD